ncbi:lipoprotein [Spiroplasma endosymbiont of Diplazon laetatorius]|uniref:lipoprotein n=1 Tax=Spiroplasma endosymbiont of Diplazon laetatorius TaxID=3066322 RepID=UPI0030D3FEBF
MKKLLGLLGAAGLFATTSATVVACGGEKTSDLSVTLKVGELSKDITVKSDKITDGGTVTTKLVEGTVLTVAVKEIKAGTTTLTISTTEDKLTEKDIKESVKVLFKSKGATSTTEIDSVSVTVKAKEKVQELKDLAQVKLTGFTATNDTTNQNVIDALKEVDGLSTISEANDVEIKKTEATNQTAGNITITAKDSSKLVKNSLKLEIAKLEVTKIKLSEVKLTGFTATNDTTNQNVIDALKEVDGLSTISEANDVEIKKTEATNQTAGNITITAKGSSTLVEGTLTLNIEKLSE